MTAAIVSVITLAIAMMTSPVAAQQQNQRAKAGQTVVCMDVPDSWQLRSKITGEHLKYIDSIKHRILIGGPVRGPKGRPVGSIIVFDTESPDEAKAFLANDPFTKNKLFATCEWFGFSQYVGTYVGGWAGAGPK